MSEETILATGAAGSVGSTAHTAIATLLDWSALRVHEVAIARW